MDDAVRVSALLRADDGYHGNVSPHYDEVLQEVSNRVAESGSIGKADIGALVLWKRMNANTPWASALNVIPEADVRKITGPAVTAARDEALPPEEAATVARRLLVGLPGCRSGDALASALLTAAAPMRLAVYDRRARKGLRILEISVANGQGRYGRYIAALDRLREMLGEQGHQWTLRRVDTALYWLANNPELAQPQDLAGEEARQQ